MSIRFIVVSIAGVLIALNLAACSSPKAAGNAHGGVIDDIENGADAYKRASEHCAAFRKSAKVTQLNGETAAFDCI